VVREKRRPARDESSKSDNRLVRFMTRHGLQTTNDLAQVFRVYQTTASRWLKLAANEPVEHVLPGPALILLELMEQGVETSDLAAMRRLAELHSAPDALDEADGEAGWRIEVSSRQRQGARLVTPGGHHIVVHPGWFRDRSRHLERLAGSARGARRARLRDIARRYEAAIEDLAGLPR
jgi:hypothetical protein